MNDTNLTLNISSRFRKKSFRNNTKTNHDNL